MKNLLLTMNLILAVAVSFGQTPESFNYQAVVRGSDGSLVASSTVSLRFSILQSSSTGTAVYVETHSANTNQHGLVNLEIGNGSTVSGTFNAIDWSAGPYYIKVELDASGGTSYTEMAVQQLLAVPYAMHAYTVENSDNDETNELQTLSVSGSDVTLSNGGGTVSLNDADADSSNELQSLSLSGSDLTLSDGGGTVSINDADADPSNEIQTLSITGSNLTLSNGGGTISVNDADADPANEIQTISKNGLDVTLSSGGGTFSIADNDNDSLNEIQTLSLSSNQLILTNGGNVDLDDINYWKAVNGGIQYNNRVAIGTSSPQSDMVVASDTPMITIGQSGSVLNNSMSGYLRFTEAVDHTTPFCGFQFNHNGSLNNLILETNCGGSGDTVITYNRDGYMSIGPAAPVSTNQLTITNTERNQTFALNTSGSGLYGISNTMSSSNTSSDVYGLSNTLSVSGSSSSYLYGAYNEISGVTTSELYGQYAYAQNSGNGTSVANVGLSYNYGNTAGTTIGNLGFAFDLQSGTTATRMTIGIYGLANANNLNGTSNGYGIYGTVSGSFDVAYAGYFAGNVYTTGSYLPSDMGLKENVQPLLSSLDKVLQLQVYSYSYLTQQFPRMNLPEGTQIGFIAQEMEQLFPELTTTAVQPGLTELEVTQMEAKGQTVPEEAKEDVSFTAVNYTGLIPHLTKAIQEQQAIIDQLQIQLNTQSETQQTVIEQQAMQIETLTAQLAVMMNTLQLMQARLDEIEPK